MPYSLYADTPRLVTILAPLHMESARLVPMTQPWLPTCSPLLTASHSNMHAKPLCHCTQPRPHNHES